MKLPRDTIREIESKILPINQVDHRFRLEFLTFGLDGVSLQARLLTSNDQDFSVQCNYSYLKNGFTEWVMMDAYGAEFQVNGLVSKTLYYFTRKSTQLILESFGYEFTE